jgi:hemerythrin-like domain-containing protein
VTDPIAQWHADHANYALLLDVLDEQMLAFHGGEQPNYATLLDIVTYLRDWPDRFHHSAEDAMLAQLALRDPSMQLPIARLLQEHRVIAEAGEALRSRLEEVIAGSVMPRADVETAAAVYLAYYRHHLASQEATVLPRAAKILTAQDWELVANIGLPGPDPLFGDPAEERYRELRAQLDARTT